MHYLRSAVLGMALTLSVPALANDAHTTIKTTLQNAGLTTPISSIAPSGVGELLTITLGGGQEPLLITPDTRYIIQGKIESNPSPAVPIDKALQTKQPAGTPVSAEYKQALLANTKQLKNMTSDTAFFHTSVDGLLWGVSGVGATPFLMSGDGRKFINGEISRIENGQFMGLDTDFEWAKNRHVLSTLDEKTLAIYPATQEKAVVYIATDINCPYCKIFHGKIGEFNRQGITVKAIGYPIYDNSHKPMKQIWCETNNAKRATLLSAAMKGILPKATCDDKNSPVISTQKAAQPLAVMATPSIYREDGVLFEGDFIQGNEFLEFMGVK